MCSTHPLQAPCWRSFQLLSPHTLFSPYLPYPGTTLHWSLGHPSQILLIISRFPLLKESYSSRFIPSIISSLKFFFLKVILFFHFCLYYGVSHFLIWVHAERMIEFITLFCNYFTLNFTCENKCALLVWIKLQVMKNSTLITNPNSILFPRSTHAFHSNMKACRCFTIICMYI